MNNKLRFYNMGTIELNKDIFLIAMRKDFNLPKEEMVDSVGGYEFLFDSETDGSIKVEFQDNGAQLVTEISGDYANEVIEVYGSYASRFHQ